MINLLWSGILIVLLVSGCGWNGTPTRQNDITPLTSITVTAAVPAIDASRTIAQHTSTTLTVNGNFSGLFTRPVTAQAVWSSDTPTVAAFVTASSPNRVTGIAPGTATLTATVNGVSSTFKITVSSATVTAMTITPASPSVPVGKSQQFTVTGTFSDGTTQDLTFDADWASSDAGAIASVNNDPASKGLAQAIAVGTANITATLTAEGVSATTPMTVTQPVLQSIALSLTNPSILTLSTVKITATGTKTDGSTSDITSQVTWNSSNTAVATIAADGTITTLTQGTTTISATSSDGSISQSTVLKATGGTLTGITLSPATVTLVENASGATTARITATGTFSNGSSRDISGVVKWAVTNTSLATVAPAVGNLEFLNPLATGTTTITAASGTVTAATPLTLIVTAPSLRSIAMSTASLFIPLTAGTSGPLTLIATFSDGTTQDVTTLSTWTSNNPTIATVAAGGGGSERVTGVAAGFTTISATYGGMTVPTPATVTVTSRALQFLVISPINSTVQAGNQVSFTATATYLDGTTVDVTQDAAWTLPDGSANVAIPADRVNQPGQFVGVDNGLTTLTATFNSKTQTTNVTVTGP